MVILPIGSMYGIYANIWGILMVNVTIYSIHGSYGLGDFMVFFGGFLIYIYIYIYFLVSMLDLQDPKSWRYVSTYCTIFLAIFWGYIQLRFLKWPLILGDFMVFFG